MVTILYVQLLNMITQDHFILVITDREVPNINCIDNQSFHTNEANPSASDNSGIVSVTCGPQSGTSFVYGHTSVTCKAVDGSGNRAECSFTGNFVHLIHVQSMQMKRNR